MNITNNIIQNFRVTTILNVWRVTEIHDLK